MPSHFPACWVKFSLVTWPVPAGLTAMIKKNGNDGTKFGSFFLSQLGMRAPSRPMGIATGIFGARRLPFSVEEGR